MELSKLARWIVASINNHFKQEFSSTPLLMEGIDERNTAFSEAPDRSELRVNGPFTRRLSKSHYRAHVFINVLVTTSMGGTVKNAYRLEDILGEFHAIMDGTIPVFTYGEDEVEQIGCLVGDPKKTSQVKVFHFGQTAPDTHIRQGAVDAGYILDLKVEES